MSALEDDGDRAYAKARALDLMDELGILAPNIRAEMLSDVERAVAVLEHAKSESGIRNRASFAIASWRRGVDPRARARPRTAELAETTEEPPTLSALEYAWSREASPIHATLIAMMAYSIERNGGAEAMLRAGWWWRERYDVDGELVERTLDGAQP